MPGMPDVVILSGGFGLRLRGIIGETPKPMAPVRGRPFMELLFKQVKRHGFSRVILSVGYKQEIIREHFGDKACGLELVYSIETSPLGTGGALRQAVDYVATENVLVMNGDSYTDADLGGLVQRHAESMADVAVVVIAETRSDAGSVVLDPGGKVKTFAEKRVVPDSRYLSAGIYVLGKKLLGTIPPSVKISLEEQLFPQWLEDGKVIESLVYQGQCVDIGTPERYQKAQSVLENAESETILRSEGQS
jgi:D-glycero-alpha-D-manno-heptose 1-phosphate guanylyltransferase